MKPLIVHPREERPHIISFFSLTYSFTCPHVMCQPSHIREQEHSNHLKLTNHCLHLPNRLSFPFFPFCFFFHFIFTFLREFASITDLRIYYLKYSTVFISVCFGYIITCDRVKHANIFDLADTSTHTRTMTTNICDAFTGIRDMYRT